MIEQQMIGMQQNYRTQPQSRVRPAMPPPGYRRPLQVFGMTGAGGERQVNSLSPQMEDALRQVSDQIDKGDETL